jgi:GDPmannose 4,6-dehydratase
MKQELTSGNVLIEVDSRYYRPTEVDILIGDPTKAWEKLGWKSKTRFNELIKQMVSEDLQKMSKSIDRQSL